jgi:hypothetical protein
MVPSSVTPGSRRLTLGLALFGCTEFGPRVYTARPYVAEECCIAGSVPIGVVQADELASTCAPVCLLLDESLYVSVVCAPYPSRAAIIVPEDSPECASAIAILEEESFCEDLPQPLSDAGLIQDAASSDSGTEP